MIKLVWLIHPNLNRVFTGILILAVYFFSLNSHAQTASQEPEQYRIVFYNVENFFDPYEDSLTGYNEFTGAGNRHWTINRYKNKRNNLYKVLTAIGEGAPVTAAGFTEIENRTVLEDLISGTPLKNHDYDIIHYDSPDDRGIDVGLIYLKEKFQPLFSRNIKVRHISDTSFRTRDILYVKALLDSDTLHLFFNHWPSRYGGLLETKELRLLASETLLSLTDSLCKALDTPAIMVVGDFNDNPEDESLQFLRGNEPCPLRNLDCIITDNQIGGTLKYQGNWNSFDQVMVSSAMYTGATGIAVKGNATKVFSPGYLMVMDKKYGGVKPYRTYEGYKYVGGFSDHLPIFVDLYHPDQQ